MARLAMLVDTTLCIGCRGCQVACKQWWDLPGVPTEQRGTYENPADLAPTTWTRVRFAEVEAPTGVGWYHIAWGCLHCADAPCVDVCPTGALAHDALGFVSLDAERCNGCGYCALACPFDVPRLERDVLSGRARASKCNFCQDRVTQGLPPACAKTCPPGAIRFGDREALVSDGRGRVAALRTAGFAEATLYGETALGGLGRLYVLPVAPARLGLPAAPRYPTTVRVWQRILRPLGRVVFIASLVGVLANLAVTWRLRRRVAEEEDRP